MKTKTGLYRNWILWAGVAAFLTTNAFASQSQTASETVAFLLFGLEDGRTLDTPDGKVSVQQTLREPIAQYRITIVGGPSQGQLVTISPINTCEFEVGFFGDGIPEDSEHTRYNFGQLVSVSKGDPVVAVNFSGQCPIQDTKSGKCHKRHEQPIAYSVPEERASRAVEYFKSNFCAGSAF